MNGPIAQIVALAIHANAFLAGYSIPEFCPGNSTCQFCEKVEFVELRKNLFESTTEKTVARSPNEWLNYLSAKGAQGVRLARQPDNDQNFPDRMSAGFVGGGGTWIIEVVLDQGRSEHWVARWEVGNQEAPDQRIWRVTYGRVAQGGAKTSSGHDVSIQRELLKKSLINIQTFSVREKSEPFTAYFNAALETVSAKGLTLHGSHRDLSPAGFLPDDAVVLLDASQSAWVFGGMGSWNDIGFEGATQEEYEIVSESLFQTLTASIVAAVNASYKNGRASGSSGPGSRPAR
jgi:hypothetical protein